MTIHTMSTGDAPSEAEQERVFGDLDEQLARAHADDEVQRASREDVFASEDATEAVIDERLGNLAAETDRTGEYRLLHFGPLLAEMPDGYRLRGPVDEDEAVFAVVVRLGPNTISTSRWVGPCNAVDILIRYGRPPLNHCDLGSFLSCFRRA